MPSILTLWGKALTSRTLSWLTFLCLAATTAFTDTPGLSLSVSVEESLGPPIPGSFLGYSHEVGAHPISTDISTLFVVKQRLPALAERANLSVAAGLCSPWRMRRPC